MKKILFTLFSTAFFILLYIFFFNQQKPAQLVTEITAILAEDVHNDDMLKKAGQIQKLKKYFTDDFKGSVENISVRGRKSLLEHLTILIRIYCPLISDVQSFDIQEEKDNIVYAKLVFKIIKAKRMVDIKEQYALMIKFIKVKEWKIQSVEEITEQ